jgi:hypothetical protein
LRALRGLWCLLDHEVRGEFGSVLGGHDGRHDERVTRIPLHLAACIPRWLAGHKRAKILSTSADQAKPEHLKVSLAGRE